MRHPGGVYNLDGRGRLILDGFAGRARATLALSADHQPLTVSFQNGAFTREGRRCIIARPTRRRDEIGSARRRRD
jgi:hypothetical protein